jgi:hypothetical protein
MSQKKIHNYSQAAAMEEEEYQTKPMNRLKSTGPPRPNLSFIHCFGDSDNFLSYNVEE